MKWTTAQENALKAKGEVVVYAAAGSGKTAVLTERVKRILTDETNPVDADRLLIVTFTNAAAAEMRTRISEALANEADRNPSPYLLRQQMLLSAAPILTIDAFCANLVRENFHLVGVSPDFRMATEFDDKPIASAIIHQLITERVNAKSEAFRLLADCLSLTADANGFSETVLSVYHRLQSMPDPKEWLDGVLAAYEGEDAGTACWCAAYCKQAVRKAKALRDLLETGDHELKEFTTAYAVLADTYQTRLTKLDDLVTALNQGDWDEAVTLLAALPMENIFRGKSFPEEGKEVAKATFEAYSSLLSKLSKPFSSPMADLIPVMKTEAVVVEELVGFLREFDDRFVQKMKESNLLTFAMVERMAFDLVCRREGNKYVPTEIGRHLSEHFSEVLVDEYQDNNRLQDVLFHALSGEGEHLFMVGDAKQSIYAFRHANPEQFIAYRNSFPPFEEGKDQPRNKVVLDANFRSRKGICDFANLIFSYIMRETTADMDYTEDDCMKPQAPYAETEQPSVELAVAEHDDKVDAVTAQAYLVVDYIRKTMAKKPFLRSSFETPEVLRKAEYGDFAVLFSSIKDEGAVFMRELRKAGIPVSFATEDFFETGEIMATMSLLYALDCPGDDLAFTAALSGPVFGLSFEEITKIKLDYPAASLYGSFASAASKEKTAEEVVNTVRRLRRAALGLPVSRFLRDLYAEFFLIERMQAMPEGQRRADNMETLLCLSDQYEQGGRNSLAGFIRYFKEASDGKIDRDTKQTGNAVRLMTVHKSKGLQFPICFLARTEKSYNLQSTHAVIRMKESVGLSVNLKDSVGKSKEVPISAKVLQDAMRCSVVAEKQRLFYVAMTRAEEKMVFLADGKSYEDLLEKQSLSAVECNENRLSDETVLSANCFLKWLVSFGRLQHDWPEESALRRYGKGGLFEVKFYHTHEGSAVKEADLPQPDEGLSDCLAERFSYRYGYSTTTESKMSVSQMMAEEQGMEYSFRRRPAILSQKGMTAAEKGTAAHRFLECADYEAAKRNLDAEIDRLVEWELLGEEQAAALDKSALSTFLDSELCRDMMASPLLLREQRFITPLVTEDGETTLVQGAVDSVYRKGDGFVLVDFKTTRFETEEEFAEHYRLQLEIYAKAMEERLEMPCREAVIYSLHLGRTVAVTLQ